MFVKRTDHRVLRKNLPHKGGKVKTVLSEQPQSISLNHYLYTLCALCDLSYQHYFQGLRPILRQHTNEVYSGVLLSAP